MKNDGKIYRLKCEPRSSKPQEDHHTQLIEYDDWMRQEEKKYSRLLTELKKTRWLAQPSMHGCAAQTRSAQFNLEEPQSTECTMDQANDEVLSPEPEATRLTDDEIRYGCGFTMEEVLFRHKKPSVVDIDGCLERTSTQYSIAFQCTLSLQEKNSSLSSVRGMVPAVPNEVRESLGRESLPLDSIMVESGQLVLQCWRGARSVSFPTHYHKDGEEHEIVYHLRPEKQNRQGE